MKVILRADVSKIGKKNEVREVSDGYAANFLLPRGLAEPATRGRVEQLEREMAREREAKHIEDTLLIKNLETLNGKTVTLRATTNEKGHLYEGLRSSEIVEAIQKELKIEIPTDAVVLKEPIKEAGLHTVPVIVGDAQYSFTLSVVGE
jgi:large subunit ribosomal protein L9